MRSIWVLICVALVGAFGFATAGYAAGDNELFVPHAPAKPPQHQTPSKPPKPPSSTGAAWSCVVVSANVAGNWDPWPGHELADIIMTEAGSGARAQCNDSSQCSLTLHPAGSTLSLKLVDGDTIGKDDPIGSGSCRVGQSCQIGQASIRMSRC